MSLRDENSLPVAIIGAGDMARQMMMVYKKLNRPITAIYSRTPSKAAALVEELGLKNQVTVYDSLLNLWEHDIARYVYIATPNNTHTRYALDAMYHGREVLVETSMVLSVQELAEIDTAIRVEKRIFMEANTALTSPLIKRLTKSIKNNTTDKLGIGKISIVDIDYCIVRYREGDVITLNKFYNRNFGGGALGDVACYPLAVAVRILGSDLQFRYCNLTVNSKFDVETNGVAYFEGPNNAHVCIKFSIDDSLPCNLAIGGNKGHILVNDFPRSTIYTCHQLETQPKVIDIIDQIRMEYDLSPDEFKTYKDVALAVQILEFEEAVASGYVKCYLDNLTNYYESTTIVRLATEMRAHAKRTIEH